MVKPLFERHPLPWRQSQTHPGFVVDAEGAVVCACIGANQAETGEAAGFIAAIAAQHVGLMNALQGVLEATKLDPTTHAAQRIAAFTLADAVLRLADDVPGIAKRVGKRPTA